MGSFKAVEREKSWNERLQGLSSSGASNYTDNKDGILCVSKVRPNHNLVKLWYLAYSYEIPYLSHPICPKTKKVRLIWFFYSA